MIMDKKDELIIKNFCYERGLKEVTIKSYTTAIGLYSQFHEMPFHELLDEAEREEQEGVKWKHSMLRTRLLAFRNHLLKKGHLANTVKGYTSRVRTVYEEGFDIEIGRMPKLNQKNVKKATPISYNDLPDKELIRHVLKMVNPLMRAIILFMTSSGCAKRETLNLTIQDFLDATYDYHGKSDFDEALVKLYDRNDVVPSWSLRRQKTNKYYTTFSSPESTAEILHYLIIDERELTNSSKLFDITSTHFNNTFGKINYQLKLGKAGAYNRFRSHMLRKFHASQLYNDGLSMDEIDELQGRGKDQTRTSYFMEDPLRLRSLYIEHLGAVTINLDVEKLSIKSPEFMRIENENARLNEELNKLRSDISSIKEALGNSLE